MAHPTIHMLTLLVLGFSFGYVLRVADLLHQREIRWFSWAQWAAAGLVGLLAAFTLVVSHDALRMFWLAAVASWVLRGRVLRTAWGAAAVAVVGVVVLDGPSLLYDPWASVYFAVVLTAGGVLHDQVSKAPQRFPVFLRLPFAKAHLFWYVAAVVYCALFWDLDLFLCFGLYAFVSGYDHLSNPKHLKTLRRLGATWLRMR